MADDLVAELTLRLQNEMSAGLDEIRNEFGGLDTTIQELNGVLGALNATLQGLQPPAALNAGMQDVVTEADAASAAVAKIGDALDADTAKITAMNTAMRNVDFSGVYGGNQLATIPGQGRYTAGDGSNAGTQGRDDPGYTPNFTMPDAQNADAPFFEDPVKPMLTLSGDKKGGMGLIGDAMIGVLGADAAEDFAKNYADFNWLMTHIAITQGLSGQAAQTDIQDLTGKLQNLAFSTGNSSTDLADAYYFMTTAGMSKDLVGQLMPSLAESSTAYNIPVMDQAQGMLALSHNMDVAPEDMGVALATLAKAGKIGHFSAADFSRFLPGLSGQLKMLGDTGIEGEDQIGAALETVRYQTGDSSETAIDMGDLIRYITSPIASRFFDRTQRSKDLLGAPILDLFKKYDVPSIDIPEFLDNEKADGIDSLDAMVDLARKIFKPNMTPTDANEIFGALFHSQQAGTAALGLVQNYDQYKADEKTLAGVDPTMLNTDYQTASQSPEFTLRQQDEAWTQLTRELGKEVMPALQATVVVLHDFNVGLEQLGRLWNFAVVNPVSTVIGGGAADLLYNHSPEPYPMGPMHRGPNPHPMQIHIKFDKTGAPTVSTANVPPGTSVTSNQGSYLNAP